MEDGSLEKRGIRHGGVSWVLVEGLAAGAGSVPASHRSIESILQPCLTTNYTWTRSASDIMADLSFTRMRASETRLVHASSRLRISWRLAVNGIRVYLPL